MDKAASGLVLAGESLAAMYNATAQVLPLVIERTDKALDLTERAVVALETIAHSSTKR